MFSFFKKSAGESIKVNEIDPLLNQIELIDIREPYEYQGGSIKRAKNIPMQKLLQDPAHYLDKNKKYYIMCQSGRRSGRVVSVLTAQSYQVVDVLGGIGAYRGAYRK